MHLCLISAKVWIHISDLSPICASTPKPPRPAGQWSRNFKGPRSSLNHTRAAGRSLIFALNYSSDNISRDEVPTLPNQFREK